MNDPLSLTVAAVLVGLVLILGYANRDKLEREERRREERRAAGPRPPRTKKPDGRSRRDG